MSEIGYFADALSVVCERPSQRSHNGATGISTARSPQIVRGLPLTLSPAAFATIRTHLEDTQTTPRDYDLIVTGDLGTVGLEALVQLFREAGIQAGGKLTDCGNLIFDPETQDVHAGGSGCGCSAIVLCSELLNKLQSGKLKRILFCGTGALLSPTSTQQKLPIPGVCHAVCIESRR